jgi:hypothetical protein
MAQKYYLHDERGRITAAVDSYDDGAYRETLKAGGYRFVEQFAGPALDGLRLDQMAVVDGAVVARAVHAVQSSADTVKVDGIDTLSISDAPACRVEILGPHSAAWDHLGGDIDLQFVVAGRYTITFDAWPLWIDPVQVEALPC